MLAAITGVGGGMIRDILAGEVPLVLKADFYATATIIGGTDLLYPSMALDRRDDRVYDHFHGDFDPAAAGHTIQVAVTEA